MRPCIMLCLRTITVQYASVASLTDKLKFFNKSPVHDRVEVEVGALKMQEWKKQEW